MTGRARAARGVLAAVLVSSAAAATSCRHAGDFLWVEDLPRNDGVRDESYLIKPGDVIGIRVWNQEANSVERARVRKDGKISVPFLNDVEVAGQEPGELAKRLQVKLKTFIMNPVVTVVVHERPPLRISVVGEVIHPGAYDLEDGAGVLHAIAAAGGLTPFADQDGVFVLRSGYWAEKDPPPARIRFRYVDLRRGKAPASLFRLRPGDAVVVE